VDDIVTGEVVPVQIITMLHSQETDEHYFLVLDDQKRKVVVNYDLIVKGGHRHLLTEYVQQFWNFNLTTGRELPSTI